MAPTQTVQVQHLGAKVGYAISDDRLDPAKPTCVLLSALCTTRAFYAAQFASAPLTAAANLVALEPLGHGATACAREQFTAWDSALVALQAMEALGVREACVLGTSQGGWIAVRMALLAPERVLGLIPVATSMDCESSDSRSKGCWDPSAFVGPFLQGWSSDVATPEFVPGDDFIMPVLGLGFGSAATPGATEYWADSIRAVYAGDEGRRKLKMSIICVAERDGLLLRLGYVKCPVHWLQGTKDPAFSSAVAVEQIQMFTGSPEAKIDFLESDSHFLAASHGKEVEQAILDMVAKV
ncbi:putative alpha/beta hydrolase [Hypoxylon cercidicola]|nr:putative alpha/beta hydrolase [Hypoxylon cercidicola]